MRNSNKIRFTKFSDLSLINIIQISFVIPYFLLIFFSLQISSMVRTNFNKIDTTFEIKNYTVVAEATADRLVYIREEIEVTFNVPRESIIRDLPLRDNVQYRDIVVEERQFRVDRHRGFLSIDMDSDNFTPSFEDRTYIISYVLDYSKAKMHKADKNTIPINIIGHGWPTVIHNIDITIILPDNALDEMYYVGKYGVTTG